MRNYPFIEPTFAARTEQLAICQSIYDANAFNIQSWRDGFPVDYAMQPELVIESLKLLEELQIDFCIGGGIACLAYIQNRNTQDLDSLIKDKIDEIIPMLDELFLEIDDKRKRKSFYHR